MVERVRYACDVCEGEFTWMLNEGEPDPDCPLCARIANPEAPRDRLQEMLNSGIPPAVSKGIHGADVTYKMLERDTGITDLNDNLREGDVAYKAPPPPNASERSAMIRAELEMKMATVTAQNQSGIRAGWNGAQAVSGDASQAIANSKHYANLAKQSGADPLSYIEAGRKMGLVPPKPRLNVMARADGQGNVVAPAVRRKRP